MARPVVPEDRKRKTRLSVSITPEIKELIEDAAEYAGVSTNAWAAMVLGTQARQQQEIRLRVMAHASAEVTRLIEEGKQAVDQLGVDDD